jgi:S-adenosylmethionine synthetase
MKRDFIHTSESVTEGHPDKLCDQISDAIIDRFLEQDFCARVTAECAVSLSVVFIAARFGSPVKVDFPNVARKVIRRIGYIDHDFNFKTCSILTSLKEMAPEDRGMGQENLCREDLGDIPISDQVTVFGFACNQTAELMPLPISLAHKLSRRLSQVRLDGILPYLAPDGTSQVAVEFKDHRPSRIHSITINTSQTDRTFPKLEQLRDDILESVINHAFADEGLTPDSETRIFVNPGGPLKLGGPAVHSGLTGRKNAIDTYGGFSRNSGSALSGKDPLRIDRVGAYAARFAAKNVVAAGLAERCEVQLSYTMGLLKPASIQVETMGTATIPEERIVSLVNRHFDFTLGGIVRQFNLLRLPSLSKGGFYRKLAAYGHFGRTDIDAPWERTDKAEALSGG